MITVPFDSHADCSKSRQEPSTQISISIRKECELTQVVQQTSGFDRSEPVADSTVGH